MNEDSKHKQYLALLRGINVGGKNVIKMAALKKCLEDVGLDDVRTYIQSGNVIFSTSPASQARLEHTIEKALSKKFNYDACAVVLPHNTFARIVTEAPKNFGEEAKKFRYDVIFLKKTLTLAKAMEAIETREGVDSVHTGQHAIYFSRITSKLTQSRLSKLVRKPEYQHMTIRNWNTTTKLLALMEAGN